MRITMAVVALVFASGIGGAVAAGCSSLDLACVAGRAVGQHPAPATSYGRVNRNAPPVNQRSQREQQQRHREDDPGASRTNDSDR